MFVVVKIIATLAVITLIVNVNDYIQDFLVIRTFWTVGYMGYVLDQQDKDRLSAVILLKFYPPAMFLTIVFIYSSIQIIFHLYSLQYRYKVSMQMTSPRSELGLVQIDPVHVVNQYNLPLSESRSESIWQMMVQCGVYCCHVCSNLPARHDDAILCLQLLPRLYRTHQLVLLLIPRTGTKPSTDWV